MPDTESRSAESPERKPSRRRARTGSAKPRASKEEVADPATAVPPATPVHTSEQLAELERLRSRLVAKSKGRR
jgi:hypothetical protein